MAEPIRDLWAQWLLHRRHGDDAEQQQSDLEYLMPVRDHILQNAQIAADDVVLDVGTGDGLIAFGALAQLGEQGRVILSGISQDCMEESAQLKIDRNNA
jgi:arsenite methyltransferase